MWQLETQLICSTKGLIHSIGCTPWRGLLLPRTICKWQISLVDNKQSIQIFRTTELLVCRGVFTHSVTLNIAGLRDTQGQGHTAVSKVLFGSFTKCHVALELYLPAMSHIHWAFSKYPNSCTHLSFGDLSVQQWPTHLIKRRYSSTLRAWPKKWLVDLSSLVVSPWWPPVFPQWKFRIAICTILFRFILRHVSTNIRPRSILGVKMSIDGLTELAKISNLHHTTWISPFQITARGEQQIASLSSRNQSHGIKGTAICLPSKLLSLL